MITIGPRYGRDYKSAEAALAAFDTYRDFTVLSGDWAGAAINLKDCRAFRIEAVNIRYDKLTKIVHRKISDSPKKGL